MMRSTGPSSQFLSVGVLGFFGVLLLIWASGDGITPPGALTGTGFYAAALMIALWALRQSYPFAAIGWCNTVTLFRLMLVSVLIAWLIVPPIDPWSIFTVAAMAFVLDGVDGWLARREGYVSEFGARFDMETDSVFALVLAVHVYLTGDVGAYVILLALPRYLFLLGQMQLSWMERDLPERFSRKIVCVVQIAALVAGLLPVLGAQTKALLIVVAAISVAWSFWRDLRWLRRAGS